MPTRKESKLLKKLGVGNYKGRTTYTSQNKLSHNYSFIQLFVFVTIMTIVGLLAGMVILLILNLPFIIISFFIY